MRSENTQPQPFLKRIVSRLSGRRPIPVADEVRRLEERRRGLQRATDQWLSLLRDMEQQGQSTDPAYDRYYRAYLDAQRQQRQVELDLFNIRHHRAS